MEISNDDLYFLKKELYGINCVIKIIKNDLNNSNGGVSEIVLLGALECVIDILNTASIKISEI